MSSQPISPSPRLPNLICAGAQKAGTSTLANILRDHPEIFIPEAKEIHFFDHPDHFAKGEVWYKAQLAGAAAETYIADFTPDYLHLTNTAQLVFDLCGPQTKILISLRHPVARAYSQFRFYQQLGAEDRLDFEQTLAEDHDAANPNVYESWDKPAHYVVRSRYAQGVASYQNLFGSENVHVLLFERLVRPRTRDAELERIYRFLGLEPLLPRVVAHSNETATPRHAGLVDWLKNSQSLKSAIKAALPRDTYIQARDRFMARLHKKPDPLDADLRGHLYTKYFQEDAQRLQDLVDTDLSDWEA